MPSPNVELNSTSLGGWTPMTNGVNVAAGETVSVRLADSAGAKLWTLSIFGTDHRVSAPTITQAGSASGTATFVAPASPSDGWALLFQSQIGVNILGKDVFDQPQDSYTTTFGVFLLTSNSSRLIATNQTTEGSAAHGWVKDVNVGILNSASGSTGQINNVRVPWKGTARFVITSNVSNLASFTVAASEGTAVAGDRILLTGQTSGAENGIYDVGTVTTGHAPLTRSSDMASSADCLPGSRVHISQGVINQNSDWYLVTTGAITLGTTPLNFQRADGGRFSARQFGAVGDGSTDDTTALNAWLAATQAVAIVSLVAGATAYLPAGAYNFTSLSQITVGITIEGDGENRSLLRCTSSSAKDFLFFDNTSVARVREIGLINTVDNLTHRAIVLNKCVNFVIEDITLSWACTGTARHKGIGIDVIATGLPGAHVPPVGNRSVIRNIEHTVDDSHGVPAAVGSRAIRMQGVVSDNVSDISIEGSSNIENAEYGIRLEYCTAVRIGGENFFQGCGVNDGVNPPTGASVSLANSQEIKLPASFRSNSPHSAYSATFTANSGTDTCTATGHVLHNGDKEVTLTNSGGALPGGLSAGVNYFIVGVASNAFQLSLTRGGPPIDITSNGTGTQTFHRSAVHYEEDSNSLHNMIVGYSTSNPANTGMNLNPDGDSISIPSNGSADATFTGVESRKRDLRNDKTTRAFFGTNSTLSTVSIQQQSSPLSSLGCHAWDTGGAADHSFEFTWQARALAGNPADASYVLAIIVNGGAPVDLATFDSIGKVTVDKIVVSDAAPDVVLSRGAAKTLKVDGVGGGGSVWATAGYYLNTAGNPGLLLGNGTSELDSSSFVQKNTAGNTTLNTFDTNGVSVNGGPALSSGGQIVLPVISGPGVPAASTVFFYVDTADNLVKWREASGQHRSLPNFTGFLKASTSWDPASLAPGGTTTKTVTVTNSIVGDSVTCGFSLDLQGLMMTGYVSSNGTVTVVLFNPTAGTVDINNGTLYVECWQHT